MQLNFDKYLIDKESVSKYSISGLIVWIAVFFIFPIIGKTLDLASIISGIIFIIGAWSAGVLILYKVESINSLKGMAKDGIAILLGAVALFWILCLIPGSFGGVLFHGAMVILLAVVVVLQKVRLFNNDASTLLAMALVLVYYTVFHNNTDLARSLAKELIHFNGEGWDLIYYTSQVSSMKAGTLTANYEIGTPLSYSLMCFAPPAALTAASSIPSHISLWGCWQPFYKVLGLVTVTEFVFVIMPVTRKVWSHSLVVLFFFFLAPLHPEYLLKGEIKNFIWLGNGHLLPGGNPPFTMSFAWISIIGVIVFYKNRFKYDLFTSIILITLIGTLILVKIPMFIPFTIFLGIIAIAKALNKNFSFFKICFGSLILSIVFYFLNYHSEGQTEVSLSPGYLPLEYAKLAGLEGILPGMAVVFAVFLIWGGIKYLGLYFLVKSSKSDENSNMLIVIAVMLSLVVSYIMAMIFEIWYVDGEGVRLYSGNLDLEQFIRGAYGLLSIITLAGFLYMIQGNVPKNLRSVFIVLCIVWCSLALASTASRTIEITSQNIPWYGEVKEEILSSNIELAAVNPSSRYSGQFLAATDMCNFWVAVRAKIGGYNLSNTNAWRYAVMDQCLSPDASERIQAYQVLVENKVQAIVASPETKEQIELFARDNDLVLPKGSKWVYPLVKRAD